MTNEARTRIDEPAPLDAEIVGEEETIDGLPVLAELRPV